MSLVFGGAASDRVVVAADTTIDNLTAFSILMWVYVTTDTNGRRFFQKNTIECALDFVNAEDVFFNVGRATTDATASSAGNQFTLNAWNCLGFTYDESNGTQIFRGTLSSLMNEVSYRGTPAVGSGATDANTSDLYIANSGTTAALQGRVARFMMFDARLTLAQLRRHQFIPEGGANCVVWHELGFNGTSTQQDHSGNGNTGTVTGATYVAHPRLTWPFPEFDAGFGGAGAAAASGSPWNYYAQL